MTNELQLIGGVRKINHIKSRPKTIKVRDYRNYDPNKMNKDLENIDWSSVYSVRDVNKAWEAIESTLLSVFKKHAPLISKRVRGAITPWLTAALKSEINYRDILLRKYRKSGSDVDNSNYKRHRNKVTSAIRKAKSMYHKDLLSSNVHNPKKFWKSLKQVYSNKSTEHSKCKEFIINGERTSKASAIADGFNNFFSSVAMSILRKTNPLANFIWRKPKSLIFRTKKVFSFRQVSKVEIVNELRKLKRNKATGNDDLPSNLLKDVSSCIANPLVYIFNLSLATSIIPQAWKVARITPLYKSGLSTNIDNYRPISVLPVVSKIFERLIHSQLADFLEKNKLLYEYQFGFRSNRSTESAVTYLTDNIQREIDKGKLVGAVFLDLSKAFDTVSHAVLISKLPSYGISGKPLELLSNYLFHRSQVVQYANIISNPTSVNRGVPQGSILGPLLFLLVINDFQDYLSHSRVIKYADDAIIYVSHRDRKTLNYYYKKI